MKRTLATLTLVLFAAPLSAQKAKPVSVEVEQINDRRTSGSFSQLTIAMKTPAIRSAEVAAARVLVAAATDDSGRNLVDAERGEPELEPNHRMAMPGQDPAAPAMVTVTLKNPDRKATKLTEVRGEIELYMPAKDANSVAEIPKFMSQSGKALNHKALKANGVEIAIVSGAQLDAEKKRIADAKRKEYKEMGYEGESLEQMLTSILSSVLNLQESELLARIKDPNKRIQEIAYVDASGDVKRVMTSDEEGMTKFYTWGGKPEADWKLRVSMKTSKNLVRHAFALTDVPLP
jgi:hypothetical protein